MSWLDDIPPVNTLEDLYAVFEQTYPDTAAQASGWEPWGACTDRRRGISVSLPNGKVFLFSVEYTGKKAGWCIRDICLAPAYVKPLPEDLMHTTPARDVPPAGSLEDLTELFCQMFPDMRDQIIDYKLWRCFTEIYRGVRMTLMDQQKVLFAIEKHGSRWDAEYPWLIPAPRESLFPLNDDVFLLFPPEQMP